MLQAADLKLKTNEQKLQGAEKQQLLQQLKIEELLKVQKQFELVQAITEAKK